MALAPPTAASPWQLISTNRVFARLWLGQLISAAGDWISFVALLALLLDLTASGMSVSLLLIARTVPTFLVTPLAGVVADRCDRRRVLIAADLLRMTCTLGFLLIGGPGDVWLAYALSAANGIAGSFFDPAAAAAIPSLVAPRQLVAANAIGGATSGVMLAVGAAAGGLVAAHFGRPAAFTVDALSFLVSALAIASVRQPFSADPLPAHPSGAVAAWRRAVDDAVEAWRYALRHRAVLAVVLIKTVGGLGGGVLALLSVIPMQVLHAGDLGVGVMYATRGLGTIVGALLLPRLLPERPLARAVAAAGGLVASGVFCVAFSASPTLRGAAFFVFMAFLGASLQWVFPAALLQQFVEDRYLGRVFALDMAALMVTGTLSTALCGWGIARFGPAAVGMIAGVCLAACGLAWIIWFAGVRPVRFDQESTAAQSSVAPRTASSARRSSMADSSRSGPSIRS